MAEIDLAALERFVTEIERDELGQIILHKLGVNKAAVALIIDNVPALLATARKVERLEAALRECRQEVADQIEADVDLSCPKSEDGTPDESEMDDVQRPMIEESRALLARIDAALDGAANG